MPIEVERGPLRVFSQKEFYELDQVVMGIAFQVHNQFGRFLDELLYKREIATRCIAAGIRTERELRVWVTHGSFRKEYKIDLVFSHGIIYEAKVVESLAPAHEAQTLNYTLLTGTHHAKLLNLRPERIHWRFVSTKLTPESRRWFTIEDAGWRAVNPRSQLLHETLINLLEDWGAFLECNLYREALTQALGGKDVVECRVPVSSDGRLIGEQEVPLVTDDTAFAISAVTETSESMRLHLQKFLTHTPLRYLQWINLNHHTIECVTLAK